MTVKVRLSGVMTPSVAQAASDIGYCCIGLVFDSTSRRCILPAAGAIIREVVPRHVKVMAIFRNAGMDEMMDVVRLVHPDTVEFEGDESPAAIKFFREEASVEVTKRLKIYEPADLGQAQNYIGSVDMLLFDVRPNKEKATLSPDLRFDWQHFRTLNLSVPWILSGGLDLENVEEILRLSRAGIINVCSGVEPKPGSKDPALIEDFFALTQKPLAA